MAHTTKPHRTAATPAERMNTTYDELKAEVLDLWNRTQALPSADQYRMARRIFARVGSMNAAGDHQMASAFRRLAEMIRDHAREVRRRTLTGAVNQGI